MKILKAVVLWCTCVSIGLIDLVIGLMPTLSIILFMVIHHFTDKVKMMCNLLIEIGYGIAWPLVLISVPIWAWYRDETIEETYLDINQIFNEKKASELI